ncbi:MAG: hypothetical protein JETT_0172 [Candidatus Jettenia ecosi]|uniref:Uncharacterized protein n=1 Tax=Candidatus Jettenia ecosi TaxID=2494326 RepID=A0A533QL70_9BACT|nr:MAG: hypothetical protein JETT_0172 [Candidatus Jettenia ecosi]
MCKQTWRDDPAGFLYPLPIPPYTKATIIPLFLNQEDYEK